MSKNVEKFLKLANVNKNVREKISKLNIKKHEDDYELVSKEILPIAREYGIEFTADEFVNFARSNVAKLDPQGMQEVSGGSGTRSAVIGVLTAAALLSAPTIFEALSDAGVKLSMSASAVDSEEEQEEALAEEPDDNSDRDPAEEAVAFVTNMATLSSEMSSRQIDVANDLVKFLNDENVSLRAADIAERAMYFLEIAGEVQVNEDDVKFDENVLRLAIYCFTASSSMRPTERETLYSNVMEQTRMASELRSFLQSVRWNLLAIRSWENVSYFFEEHGMVRENGTRYSSDRLHDVMAIARIGVRWYLTGQGFLGNVADHRARTERIDRCAAQTAREQDAYLDTTAFRKGAFRSALSMITPMVSLLSFGIAPTDVARSCATLECLPDNCDWSRARIGLLELQKRLAHSKRPGDGMLVDYMRDLYDRDRGVPDGEDNMTIEDLVNYVLVPWVQMRDDLYLRLEQLCDSMIEGVNAPAIERLRDIKQEVAEARRLKETLTPEAFFAREREIKRIGIDSAAAELLVATENQDRVTLAYATYEKVDRSRSWRECVDRIMAKLHRIRFNVLGMTDPVAREALMDDIAWVCSKMWQKGDTFYLWTREARAAFTAVDSYGALVYKENAEPNIENRNLELLQALHAAGYDLHNTHVQECIKAVKFNLL